MSYQLSPKVGVARSSVVTSDPVTITGTAQGITVTILSATLTSATLLKNGAAVGTTTTATNGDTIAVRGTAPSSYASPAYANVRFEKASMTSFGVFTELDPAGKVLDPAFVDVPASGFYDSYTPSSPQNKLHRIAASNNAVTTTNISVVPSPVSGSVGDGLPYVFAADYVADRVHRINPSSGVVAHSLSVTKPFSVHYTPTLSDFDNTVAHTLVACPDTNQVHVYDGDNHSLLHSVSVGLSPHGVSGAPSSVEGEYTFFVACFDDDAVQVWRSTGGAAPTLLRTYYLDEGSGPYHVIVDSEGNGWVSCLKSDKLAKLNANDTTFSYASLAQDPWGLDLNDTYVFVACAGTNKVCAVHRTTLAVTQITTIANPTSVAVTSGKLWVGSFNYGNTMAYTLSGTTVSNGQAISASQRLVEGLSKSEDDTQVFLLNMHNDLPERTAFQDRTPDGLTFGSASNQSQSTVVTSPSGTIAGAPVGTTLYIPNVYSTQIVKNGVAQSGQAVSVVGGDSVAVRLATPSENISIYIPVFDSGGGVRTFVVLMTPGAKIRIGGWIKGG